jgi:hypothetical protein
LPKLIGNYLGFFLIAGDILYILKVGSDNGEFLLGDY